MRIDKLHTELVRPEANRDAQGAADAEAVKQASAPVEVPRADSVEISDAGRALAQGAGDLSEALSPEKVSELRQMVVGGKYDRPEVIAEVARRMSASGDLTADLGE